MIPKSWWWILLLSINFFDVVVFSDQIFQAHTGGTFGQSSREPKYNIEFHHTNAPFHPDDGQESLLMSNKNGEKYKCFMPNTEKRKTEKLASQQKTSSMIMGMERRLKQKTPDELLEVMKDHCLLRQEGWWSYEFCYQKKLRQIHVEDEKVDAIIPFRLVTPLHFPPLQMENVGPFKVYVLTDVYTYHGKSHWRLFTPASVIQGFVLGVYDAAATEAYHQNLSDISTLKDPRSKDASKRYHAHQYTNGTICDLTNQPRETEVRFVCSEPRAMISSITELSTCKYALTVHCPTLCKHPLFQEEKPVWYTIHCNALSTQGEVTRTKEESVADGKIAMITALLPNLNLDGYAT